MSKTERATELLSRLAAHALCLAQLYYCIGQLYGSLCNVPEGSVCISLGLPNKRGIFGGTWESFPNSKGWNSKNVSRIFLFLQYNSASEHQIFKKQFLPRYNTILIMGGRQNNLENKTPLTRLLTMFSFQRPSAADVLHEDQI